MPFRPSGPVRGCRPALARSLFPALTGLLGLFLVTTPAAAAVIQVPGDHSTITAALAAAGPNDEIQVAPGTYAASTNGETFPLFLTTAGIQLTATGPGTILDGEDLARVVHVNATGNVRVSGFTITRGFHTVGGGMNIVSGTPEVDHNLFIGNGAAIRGAGILAGGTSAPWIHHNVVWESYDTDTVDTVDPHGVLLQTDATGIVEHNLIGRTDGNGLLTSNDAQPIVRHNIFLENGQPDPIRGRGICWLSNAPAIMTHNLFHANTLAAVLWPAGGGNLSGTAANDVSLVDQVYGNLDGDPLLVDPDNGNYELSWGSPAIDAGDPLLPLDPDGTVADLGPFYFDQSTVGVAATPAPAALRAFPNPFRFGTRVSLDGASAPGRLEIFDAAGRRVRSVRTSAGAAFAEWDGRDSSGRPVAAGVYLARLVTARSAKAVPLVRIR